MYYTQAQTLIQNYTSNLNTQINNSNNLNYMTTNNDLQNSNFNSMINTFENKGYGGFNLPK